MLSRRKFITMTAALPVALSTLALDALASEKFTEAALQAAQKDGKKVLVEVAAPWCPVCRAQQPILEGLAKNEKFKDFVFLRVDFDNQKEELRKLNVRTQSTLIVFKGANEVGRSIGDTHADSIEALLTKAI